MVHEKRILRHHCRRNTPKNSPVLKLKLRRDFIVHPQPRNLPCGCVQHIPRIIRRLKRRRRWRRNTRRPVRTPVAGTATPTRPASDTTQYRLRRPSQTPSLHFLTLQKPPEKQKTPSVHRKEKNNKTKQNRTFRPSFTSALSPLQIGTVSSCSFLVS